MEQYMEEVLDQESIWPCTSPAAVNSFLFEKKEGGLRPRIGYQIQKK